ncbi:MAG: endonuclease, partial [Actinomycetes bacterium]|nr:endonuclease [Actinomycetes bacterium]MDX5400639.1 endonuclease [Actinomycetes bacterium]
VPRDDEAIARLVVLEARFWEYVETDTPPPTDGSESSARALRKLYPGGGDTVDLRGDPALGQALEDLRLLRDELDVKQATAETLRQRIQQAMGDASRAVLSTGEISFKRAKDGVSIDTRQLTLDHPDLVARYTTTRPGARRFLILDKPT